MNYTDRSHCCNAPVTVYTGSDGTNSWRCTKCHKACNLALLKPTNNASDEAEKVRLTPSRMSTELREMVEGTEGIVATVFHAGYNQAVDEFDSEDTGYDKFNHELAPQQAVDALNSLLQQAKLQGRIDEARRARVVFTDKTGMAVPGCELALGMTVPMTDRIATLQKQLEEMKQV